MHSEKRHTTNTTERLRRLTLLGLILGQLLGTLLVVFTCRDGECPLQRMRRVVEGDKPDDRPDPTTDFAILGANRVDCASAVVADGQGSGPPANRAHANHIAAHTFLSNATLSALSSADLAERASLASFLNAQGQSSRSILHDAPKLSPPHNT
ncbi:MAG: hypothetical protein VYE40_00155 [Myxococcota bacterium]|nr:hypothetical protein [Myxococcota bacterium]